MWEIKFESSRKDRKAAENDLGDQGKLLDMYSTLSASACSARTKQSALARMAKQQRMIWAQGKLLDTLEISASLSALRDEKNKGP